MSNSSKPWLPDKAASALERELELGRAAWAAQPLAAMLSDCLGLHAECVVGGSSASARLRLSIEAIAPEWLRGRAVAGQTVVIPRAALRSVLVERAPALEHPAPRSQRVEPSFRLVLSDLARRQLLLTVVTGDRQLCGRIAQLGHDALVLNEGHTSQQRRLLIALDAIDYLEIAALR